LADAEVQAVLRSGLTVTPRIGQVTHADVLSDITDGDYDGLWFAGHMASEGMRLSDGVLTKSELVPLVRDRFEFVFLNSCDSRETARLLSRETDAEIIATVVEVPDRLAFQTGALFARSLAETGDIATAYNAAIPGDNRTYVHLAPGTGKKKWIQG
jgi:hypothetical protein